MFLTQTTQNVFDALLALTYPQSCSLCGASVERRSFGIVCEACWSKSRILSPDDQVCWKCGVPSAGKKLHQNLKASRCGRCESQPFTAARACGVYEGALRESILWLKRQPHVPQHLVSLLVAVGKRDPISLSSRVVPVPLHRNRIKQRGFNQAQVLARILAKSLDLPLDEVSLVRVGQYDKHRAGLDSKGRRDSVSGAFTIQHPRLVEGEDILLVDDVFTTGATAAACAEVLMTAGARNVFVVTVARPAW